MKHALTIFIVSCIALVAAGQTARVAGLEKNARYMELLAMEQTLRIQEDSISGLLGKARTDLRSLPDQRARLGAEILRLENRIFDVRNQMGIVAGQINIIEQEYIISNMGSAPLEALPGQTAGPAGATASGQTLPAYVAKNLDAADLAVWKKASTMEKQISALVDKYMDNYAIAKRLADDYAVETSAARADTIYNRLSSYSRTNQAISDSVGKLWVYVFDNKSYLCNLLMDKANNHDYLASAEERAQALQARQAQLRGTFASDVVGLYPIEKRYVLERESAIAQFIGDKKSADSLSGAMTKLGALASPERIDLKERVFITYENVRIAGAPVYNASKPIPETEVHKHGTVYRIQVGAFLKPQLPNVFRNAAPLSCLQGDDGRYRYFAGGYETMEQAAKGLEMLKKAGFRAPEIVVWQDGKYGFAPKAGDTAADSGELYRVEISSPEGTLDEGVRSIIQAMGGGREIARVAGRAEDGTAPYTFIVGTFDVKTDAEALAQAVRTAQPALVVKVTETKPVAES